MHAWRALLLFSFMCTCLVLFVSPPTSYCDCKCFQCGQFWLPALSVDLLPLAFSRVLRVLLLYCIYVLRSCFAGHFLLFTAWMVEVSCLLLLHFHLRAPKFWGFDFCPLRTHTRTEFLAKRRVDKPCFARLTNFKHAQAWTKLGYASKYVVRNRKREIS